MAPSETPVVVIVGGGFGGLWAARALKNAPVKVILIDRTNHHLFQPLLYQVATAGLSPADIAHPIRSILKKSKNTTVLLDVVTGIDRENREVITESRRVKFDYLIIATGMKNSYFGHDDWADHAAGLKTVDDATWIRREILLAFEKAEMSHDPEEQRRLLTFAVIGGGPTGVEMSGAIAELGRHALRRDFRRIQPEKTRVVLLEGGNRVLEAFHPETSEAACRSLESMGVEIKLNSRVVDLQDGLVVYQTSQDVGGHTTHEPGSFEAGTVIWAAGVRATPVGDWLGLPADLMDRAGRVRVTPTCNLPDDSSIYVIGDVMTLAGADGRPLPGVCQTAMQQGTYAARRIEDFVAGLVPTSPFEYKDKGNMATIGRKSAVAEIGRARFSGLVAWFLWLGIHIIYLIGFDTKLRVLIEWAWAYIVWGKGARLITGDNHKEAHVLPK